MALMKIGSKQHRYLNIVVVGSGSNEELIAVASGTHHFMLTGDFPYLIALASDTSLYGNSVLPRS